MPGGCVAGGCMAGGCVTGGCVPGGCRSVGETLCSTVMAFRIVLSFVVIFDFTSTTK